jgi:quinoprotein glucose dehydrogenase
VPSVYSQGQGGLLDSELGPSFSDSRWIYLTYSATNDVGESATHLGRGRLDVEAGTLDAFEQLHVAEPFVDSSGHFGSRVAFGPDGFLYQTVGDRQFKDFGPDHVAQDLTNELGTTLRLEVDGSVPEDNPFVDDPDARDAIYSYGHRNAQGMAVHPETGAIWQSEFGEQDGDEINVLERGGNYGWPVADEGCTYGSGEPIGVSHDDREDVVAPVYSWPCGSGGFPPSGMTFYTGSAFPEWQGDLFVGGLASQSLARFTVDGTDVTEAGQLLSSRGWRIRDVAQGVDEGALYAAVDADDAPIVRLTPA